MNTKNVKEQHNRPLADWQEKAGAFVMCMELLISNLAMENRGFYA
jgi:hypothetical protein